MTHRFTLFTVPLLLAGIGAAAPLASAAPWPGARPAMDILVAGSPLPAYPARGTLYVEAMKGREYEIRIRNPYPVRVAVALSVDGLNTIDARHTSAADARKWVIEPYDTITISGWQTSLSDARRFEFTSEERSYGAWLGKTDDLGVVTAVFYRERVRERVVSMWPFGGSRSDAPAPAPNEQSRDAAAPSAEAKGLPVGQAGGTLARKAAEDEYAATGIGRRIDHGVTQVHLDLESTAAASISIRYEYRAQLVRLGVLPPAPDRPDPLDRRERARGFDAGFCPVPQRRW
jgi:hypothetical protein